MTEFIINDNGPTQSWQTSVSFASDCDARSYEDIFVLLRPLAEPRVCVEVQEDVISMR